MLDLFFGQRYKFKLDNNSKNQIKQDFVMYIFFVFAACIAACMYG